MKRFLSAFAISLLMTVPVWAAMTPDKPQVNWLGEEYTVDEVSRATGTSGYDSNRCFDSGMFAGYKKDGESRKSVFINTQGQEALTDINNEGIIQGFRNGYALIIQGGKLAYINPKGEALAIPEEMIDVSSVFYSFFSQGMMPINSDFENYYLTEDGQPVLAGKYDRVNSFEEDLAPILEKGATTASYINKEGEVVIKTEYSAADGFSSAMARVYNLPESGRLANLKIGYINKEGATVVAPIYKNAGRFYDGFAAVQKEVESDWQLIDTKGNTVFAIRAGHLGDPGNGFIPVMLEGKYGYVDQRGKMAIEPQFDMATRFNEGFALVTKDGRVGIIDAENVKIVERNSSFNWILPILGIILVGILAFFIAKRYRANTMDS